MRITDARRALARHAQHLLRDVERHEARAEARRRLDADLELGGARVRGGVADHPRIRPRA
jgi:hypothetical protein